MDTRFHAYKAAAPCEEFIAYHATTTKAARAILKEGFRMDVKRSTTSALGQGHNLGVDLASVVDFAKQMHRKYIVVSRVVVRKWQDVESNLPYTRRSGVDAVRWHDFVVVFLDDQILPMYAMRTEDVLLRKS
jgi:hypothetical protein